MKIAAINGSACKEGNNAILINQVLAEMEAEGLATELLHMKNIQKSRKCMKK